MFPGQALTGGRIRVLAAPVRAGCIATQSRRLERALHHASIDAQSCAVGRSGERARYESNKRADLLRRDEPFQQRRGPHVIEELFLNLFD